MTEISMILFALAVSVDGFGAGFAYGVRGIKIPFWSLVVISVTSSSAVAVSMLSGSMAASFIDPDVAEIIGAVILGLMGIFMLLQVWAKKYRTMKKGPEEGEMLFRFRVPPLGILVQVLREPSKADMDNSGVISIKEAFLLGLALAMDALGAGFGVAVGGFPPLWTALHVGIFKFFMVSIAVRAGRLSARNCLQNSLSLIPGLIFLMLSINKFR